MNDILMQVRDLSYRYEDQTLALDKVNLDIRRHENIVHQTVLLRIYGNRIHRTVQRISQPQQAAQARGRAG